MLNKKYRLLGIEELSGWICEFCNKKEINNAYTVEDTETGNIFRFGSSCIKKALKITTKELNSEIKAETEKIEKKYRKLIFAINREHNRIMNEYREKHNYKRGFLPESELEYWNLVNRENRLYKRKSSELSRYRIN